MNNKIEGYLISYSEANNIPTIITYFSFFIFVIIFGCFLILILLKIIKDRTQNLNDERNWLLFRNRKLFPTHGFT